ncbi:MAG: hypothetical protein ACPG4T_21650, partial [Nannocystaceae bacterium]
MTIKTEILPRFGYLITAITLAVCPACGDGSAETETTDTDGATAGTTHGDSETSDSLTPSGTDNSSGSETSTDSETSDGPTSDTATDGPTSDGPTTDGPTSDTSDTTDGPTTDVTTDGPTSDSDSDSDSDTGMGTFECSADLHGIINENNELVETCPPEQGCLNAECVPACDASDASGANFGCMFMAPTPPSY